MAAHDAQSFVAHTLDDRRNVSAPAGRGSGVDGLSAMKPAPRFHRGIENVEVLRPLLEIGRAELRAFSSRVERWFKIP
jgi:tRNA(Ile)-lysidine synthase TilS/MesJ